MTFLILFLAFVTGIFIGVFLFGEVLALRKNTVRKSSVVVRMIIWCVIAVVLTVLIMKIYAYGIFGLLCGILIGLGCDLYSPSENNQPKE